MTKSSARASQLGDEDGGDQGNDDDAFSPLFVDGIEDMVDYHRVLDLFAQHGSLRNVFVQRLRKQGRKFRFGFVRFFSRKDASLALSALNGFKLGGAVLRIGWARNSTRDVSEKEASKGAKEGSYHRWKPKVLTKTPSKSWRDVVLGRTSGSENHTLAEETGGTVLESIRGDEAPGGVGGKKAGVGSKVGGVSEGLRDEVKDSANALRDFRKEIMESFLMLKSFTCAFKEVTQQLLSFRDLFNSITERKLVKETINFAMYVGDEGQGLDLLSPEYASGLEERHSCTPGEDGAALHGGNDGRDD